MTNEYHFITRWRVKAKAAEVYDIIGQPLEFPRWWPSVYLSARAVGPGRVAFHTSGWLPYTLHFESQTVEKKAPEKIVAHAIGDFVGRGIWSFAQDGEYCDVTFDWKLSAEKRLLRYLSPIFRPAFEANHRWAMEQGRRSLELELDRYRAQLPGEMNLVPAPRGPNELQARWVAAGSLVVAAGIAVAIWNSRKRE